MTHEEIAAKVKAIIVDKLGRDESEVTESANIVNDLGADSLDTVDLILALEHEFGLSISEEDASSIQTVGDAIKCVEDRLNA